MANGKSGKLKPGVLGALLPIALAELLVSKGIITKDELNKAMTKTVLEVAIKQKAAKSSPGSPGRKREKAKGGGGRERKG